MRRSIISECALCHKKFEKSISSLKNSRSGFYFCCRKHKDLAQRIDSGVKGNFRPSHYKGELCFTRTKALRYYEHKCNNCNYDEILSLIEVHHIDGNRNNNKIENLILLCCRCHRLLTLGLAYLENRKLITNK